MNKKVAKNLFGAVFMMMRSGCRS